MSTNSRRLLPFGVSIMLAVAACGGGGSDEPLSRDAAADELNKLVDDIGWIDDQVSRRAAIPPPSGADLAATLPPIDEFPVPL